MSVTSNGGTMKRKVSEAEKAYRLERTRAFLLECVMYSTRSLKWGIDNWGRKVEPRRGSVLAVAATALSL